MTDTESGPGYKRQAFFESDAIDQLVSMVLELAAEQWVTRERLYLLEHAADRMGLKLREALETYQPDAAERTELEQMRTTMIRNLMRTVNSEHRRTRPKIAT